MLRFVSKLAKPQQQQTPYPGGIHTIMKISLAIILPLLALILAALAWWQWHHQPQNLYTLPVNQSCNLHMAKCHTTFANNDISLDITPKPIPIAKTLQIHTQIEHLPVVKVQLDINGSNMYMGYNRVSLTKQNDGSWTGKSLLAFCTTDKMNWQLTLLIDLADGHQIQAPFLLSTPYQP